MHSNDKLARQSGSFVLELLLLLPLALLALALAADGSRIFEARSAVTSAIRNALLSDTKPLTLGNQLVALLTPSGYAEVTLAKVSVAIDPIDGRFQIIYDIQLSTTDSRNIDLRLAIQEHCGALAKSSPFPFATPFRHTLNSPTTYASTAELLFIRITLSPRLYFSSSFRSIMGESFRIRAEHLLPFRTPEG